LDSTFEALSYILEDEKLEVTPKRVAMRKAILDANERRILAKVGPGAEAMKDKLRVSHFCDLFRRLCSCFGIFLAHVVGV